MPPFTQQMLQEVQSALSAHFVLTPSPSPVLATASGRRRTREESPATSRSRSVTKAAPGAHGHDAPVPTKRGRKPGSKNKPKVEENGQPVKKVVKVRFQ